MSKELLAPGLRGLLVSLVVLQLGCAAQRQLLAERESTEIDAEVAQTALALEPTIDALKTVTRLRDGRRDAEEVARLSRHPEPAVRSAALRALGLIGDPRSIPAMTGGLDDSVASVRAMAAFAVSQHWAWPLTKLQARTTAAGLEQLLVQATESEIEDQGLQSPALPAQLRALSEFGGADPVVEILLWSLLEERELPRRAQEEALRSLAVQGRAGRSSNLSLARVEVLSVLHSSDDSLDWRLAYLLAQSKIDSTATDSATALLEVLLASDSGSQERCWALRALGKSSSPRNSVLLRAALVEPDVTQRDRLCAVRGARSLGIAGAELLRSALSDPSGDVVTESAHGLGALGEFGLGALSGWSLDGRLDSSRLAVARLQGISAVLGAHGAESPDWLEVKLSDLLAELRAALSSDDPQLRAAAYGLGAVHPSVEAVGLLLERISIEKHSGAQIALALALSSRAEDQIEGVLLGWLLGDDPVLGAIAAEGLGKRPAAHINEQLMGAFERFPGPEQVERRQAIVAALKESGAITKEQRAAFLSDSEAHVRMEAYEGFSGDQLEPGVPGPPQQRESADDVSRLFDVSVFDSASIETSRGTIQVALLPELAPAAVANFASLARQGLYDEVLFHRVVPDFVVQAGDPGGTGWGGPGYTIRDEFSPLPFGRGTLGMARAGKDTAGSQWFITHSSQPHLDGHYTIFGQVIDGWDVLDSIEQGDRVQTVSIAPRDEKPPASR